MEFMEMLREWLDFRDADSFDREDTRPIHKKSDDLARMDELEQEINKRMRGEL